MFNWTAGKPSFLDLTATSGSRAHFTPRALPKAMTLIIAVMATSQGRLCAG
jgi:hypothetical protein